MSAFDKLLERIPYASGTLRRRLISGIIVSVISIGAVALQYGPEGAGLRAALDSKNDFASIAKSTQFLLLTLLVIYAIGALVDVISDNFVVRGAAVVASLVGPLPAIWTFASSIVWPFLLLGGTIYSTYRRRRYDLGLSNAQFKDNDIREALGGEALSYLENRLAANIRIGLNEPFGGKAEAAWQAIFHLMPEAHRSWVVSLNARNHEMSSFLSAVFLATLGSLITYVLGHLNTLSSNVTILALLYFVLWFVSYLFLGYTSIVRRSVASVVEFLAFIDRVAPAVEHSLVVAPGQDAASAATRGPRSAAASSITLDD